ncbi:hypothetical protein ACKVMH_02865 [Lysobacter zhanggongensis]|uniref:Uncharacterized protein n=1 Tax=Lysobacter zhanggongensis TaxID=1774951 RepID=A0ABU7YMT3_9GAMM
MADWQRLREAAPASVPDDALVELVEKIVFAGSDAMRCASHVPARDQLAQLKKLKRRAKQAIRGGDVVIDADGREHRFVKLADNLANLDQVTFERIKAVEHEAMKAALESDGVFIDADGAEYHSNPPTIQVVRPYARQQAVLSNHSACRGVVAAPRTPASVWFPRGVEEFMKSVEHVIGAVEGEQGEAGNREKPWQGELAEVVIEFWRTHCPGESQSANRNSKTGKASSLVVFAGVVFKAANPRQILSYGTLANLLNTCK